MRRLLLNTLVLLLCATLCKAMDFGLRFNSHSLPLEKRTSLSLGEAMTQFDKELKIGFHFDFYTQPLFGTIVSLKTDDGTIISVVASHQGNDTFKLGIVANERMKLMKDFIDFNPDREDHIDICLDKPRNVVLLRYNDDEIEMSVPLAKTTAAAVTFGLDKNINATDVAPIELRNIRIFVDNKNTNWWDLKFHESPVTSIDRLGNVEARVSNPHWLIDDHTDWKLIYSRSSKDRFQTAFDPKEEAFYIAGDKNILKWFPLKGDSLEYQVTNGFRPMAFSNHLMFDSISERLVNYNLSRHAMSRFDRNTGTWSAIPDGDPSAEANYANHAFAVSGNVAYAFGGYGFYKFNNNLFRINLSDGSIEEIKLNPEMTPVTSAAACVVGDKLYIFGGKGNSSGRQELPTRYYYAMYAYDTKTWKGSKVWELDSVANDFLPSQTMYYDSADDCFYAASTCNGGEMVRISRTRPEVTVLSTPINTKMEYHDFVFDLFRSNDGKRYYLLIDKRLDADTHDYAIYTISAPFIEDPDIVTNKTEIKTYDRKSGGKSALLWIVGIVLAACAAIFIYFVAKRKRWQADAGLGMSHPAPAPAAEEAVTPTDGTAVENDCETEEATEDLSSVFENKTATTRESHFDRSKSSISLLGAFNVRSASGEDITSEFTDRLKSLLILLLLGNTRSDNGIKYQTIDEQIWPDKDEKSAQNNRNVYMRKLRVLLKEVGDVAITYDKGYFKIHCDNIMFDYGEALKRINEIQTTSGASPELVNEILDLLLMGPLLPTTTYEWVDQYKAEFSARALDILNKLLKYEFSRDDELCYRIAQTISCHEFLSEEAMKAKCILLSRKKMVSQAKTIYDRFCKDYKQSLGEDYPLSFPEVCKSSI